MVTKTGGARDGRAAERRPAMAPSTMRVQGLAATDVTVLDLSQTGIRIASAADLLVGEEISIGLSGVGTRRAYVAWRRDGLIGCAFVKPLVAAEVAHAFTSASVVRFGNPAQDAEAAGTGGQADLQDLYGAGGVWRLPLDALLVLAFYLLLSGWAAYHLLMR